MNTVRRIGIDLMGGEHSPLNVWHALAEVILSRKDAVLDRFVFCPLLTPEFFRFLEPLIAKLPHWVVDTLSFVFCKDVVDMNDSPFVAVRKKHSSMAIGVDLLANDQLDSLFSTGSTAALMTLSCSRVPRITSIGRPALLVELPTLTGSVVVLDVGANISVKPENLLDFGRMGVAYYQCLNNIDEELSIGLLNIGSEERKGTENHRQTFRMLQDFFKDRFIGNVESQDVFKGKIHVLVTDGFTGNIFLKTAEGVFDFLASLYARDFGHSSMRSDLEGSIYPGSVLCGLSKLVVKGHGMSQNKALFKGISGLMEKTEKGICQKIADNLNGL